MWGEQCNTCGGHENEIRFIVPCKHCATKICNGCRVNHETVCEQMTKQKRAGQGPTVIEHHDIPAVPDISASLPEAIKVDSQLDPDAVNAELAAVEAEANELALEQALSTLAPTADLPPTEPGDPSVADPTSRAIPNEAEANEADVAAAGEHEAAVADAIASADAAAQADPNDIPF